MEGEKAAGERLKTPVQIEKGRMAAAERHRSEVEGGHDMLRGHKSQGKKSSHDTAALRDYTLGDCIGKGAFGSVYRALNWGTGETVAVKQIRLVDLPESELRVIMLEIDLLKNLHHPNIVKYHGFHKTSESLYIILEYCENGSLYNICKNFGKFPENLLALYMAQVLQGLLFLHEQGVIHRDIKGANILTTKEGLVKLADFGVATKANGLHESTVVGTPYWMAPEVIELSGATTASDIWSLGCTVIELLDGKPPYHKLQPMPALFRIVNDDHPPLPEGASPAVRDFLMQCFQKDPNLRVSAKKLLRHPWILSAKKTQSVVPTKPYDEAVKSVQQWNEALKSPGSGTVSRRSRPAVPSAIPTKKSTSSIRKNSKLSNIVTNGEKVIRNPEAFRSPDVNRTDNWDNDFAPSLFSGGLNLPQLKPQDNFAGQLSSDKLKHYATFDSPHDRGNSGRSATDEPPVAYRTQIVQSDPHQTVQPFQGNAKKGPAGARRESSTKLSLNKQRQVLHQSPAAFREDSAEDNSDLVATDDIAFERKVQLFKNKKSTQFSPSSVRRSEVNGKPHVAQLEERRNSHQNVRTVPHRNSRYRRDQSPTAGISRYTEQARDEDFDDIFGGDGPIATRAVSDSGSESSLNMMMLNSKLSGGSRFGEDEDEDDPFAQLEEDFDEIDLEINAARDRYARLCTAVESLVGSLKTSQSDDVLEDISEQLIHVLTESPDVKNVIVSSHGMLPVLEILESCQRRDVVLRLLKIVNMIIFENVEIQENLCFVGGIPIITKFAHKKYSSEIRLEAAEFVRQMYQTSTLTLQMFISCGGLNVLVEFLEEDLETERELVLIGVNGVWSVFELQGPTPKNDFCRIFSRSSVLYPLSLVLNRILEEDGGMADEIEGRIVNIFLIFSQAENYVKEIIADRMVLKRVLKDLARMSPPHQITMLKFIKNLSMLAATHDSLQNSNAIEVLTDLLASNGRSYHLREVSNQILNIIYNLCRLSKTRQEDAALNGVIPLLQDIVRAEWPLKEFAIPVLCDMAHSGKVGRKLLWQNKGLQLYISLLTDRYWQVTALDAIFIWLQEETAKVEEHLLEEPFCNAILGCFTSPDTSHDAFEKFLEPLQKMLRLSLPIAAHLGRPELFARTAQKLSTKKPVVRLNLLRIIRSICDASEGRGGSLIRTNGLYDSIVRLADGDPAILVREMASELVRLSDGASRRGYEAARHKYARQSSTSSITSPAPLISSSLPPTPQHARISMSPGTLETPHEAMMPGPSSSNSAFSSVSTGSSSITSMSTLGWNNAGGKSKLPRTSTVRASKSTTQDHNTDPTGSSTISQVPSPTVVMATPKSKSRMMTRSKK